MDGVDVLYETLFPKLQYFLASLSILCLPRDEISRSKLRASFIIYTEVFNARGTGKRQNMSIGELAEKT